MVIDPTREVERAYEVPGTPFVYLLNYKQQVLIRGLANNWQQLESLLEQEGTVEPTRSTADESGELLGRLERR